MVAVYNGVLKWLIIYAERYSPLVYIPFNSKM